MQMYTSTISSQGQLTLPAKIRQHLGISAGSVVVWEIRTDNTGIPQVNVKAGTVGALKKLRGVGKKLYRTHGGGEKALQQERAAWDR